MAYKCGPHFSWPWHSTGLARVSRKCLPYRDRTNHRHSQSGETTKYGRPGLENWRRVTPPPSPVIVTPRDNRSPYYSLAHPDIRNRRSALILWQGTHILCIAVLTVAPILSPAKEVIDFNLQMMRELIQVLLTKTLLCAQRVGELQLTKRRARSFDFGHKPSICAGGLHPCLHILRPLIVSHRTPCVAQIFDLRKYISISIFATALTETSSIRVS